MDRPASNLLVSVFKPIDAEDHLLQAAVSSRMQQCIAYEHQQQL
jgi:hypothetical protein